METGRKQAFYWRAFVTFYVVFSFLAIAASGLVLYVAPPGRVANWSQWRFAALLKADWQAVHTVFSLVFVAAAAAHVYFNWRVIGNYLRRKVGEGLNRGRELGLASAAGAAVLAFTLAGVPPFSTVVSVGEAAKNSWSDPATEPPVPHAELWTVAKFAEANHLTAEQAMENLRAAGMSAPAADVTIQVLASTYKTTPRQVYLKAMGQAKPAAVSIAEGGGYGRRNVGQLCDEANVPVETALERLRQAGFTGATAGSNLRQLAADNGRRPIEVAQAIQGRLPTVEEGHR
jgi:hypothetical protein